MRQHVAHLPFVPVAFKPLVLVEVLAYLEIRTFSLILRAIQGSVNFQILLRLKMNRWSDFEPLKFIYD